MALADNKGLIITAFYPQPPLSIGPSSLAFLFMGGTPTVTVPPTGETVEVYFVWDAVPSAVRYTLRVGTSHGASNVYDGNVGDVLTASLTLNTAATYHSRVLAYDSGGALLNTTDEQDVTV